MRFDLFPYGKPVQLKLAIQVLRPVQLHVCIFDSHTRRIYSERKMRLKTNGRFLFKLPVCPDQLTVELHELHLPRVQSVFRIAEISIEPDRKCPVDLTAEDVRFIRFAKWFACQAVALEAGEKGTLYQSDGFTILYVDRMVEDGKELSTPARISKDSGVIQISKTRTLDYTVPMLLVMLLHEYAHKFKNKTFGKAESNELTADLIACHIALNLGFDAHEVRACFREVFERKQTKLNKNRMAAIDEFVAIFKQSEQERCQLKRS